MCENTHLHMTLRKELPYLGITNEASFQTVLVKSFKHISLKTADSLHRLSHWCCTEKQRAAERKMKI